ncbi:MAG: mechanosensitive ion channel [Bacteroidales bacterium]|jgi:small-conductance mechanosensitive channel
MNIREFLEFEILSTKNFKLTVYHLLVAFVILLATWFVNRMIHRLFRRQEKRNRIDIGTSRAIYQIIKYILWVIAIAFALETIGIKITFFLAGSAALLVGLGLGLQEIFQDFVSGITLLIEGTLKVNDVVQTADGEVGRVKQINLRTSKLETRDNIILIVPNSKLINDVVINWSHHEKRTRFSVKVGVAYGSDVQLVKKVLLECAEKQEDVFTNPAPFVRFLDFGNSSLDFELFFWTAETFRVEDTKSNIRFKIDAAFRKNKIKIPFPQRDVHLFPNKPEG